MSQISSVIGFYRCNSPNFSKIRNIRDYIIAARTHQYHWWRRINDFYKIGIGSNYNPMCPITSFIGFYRCISLRNQKYQGLHNSRDCTQIPKTLHFPNSQSVHVYQESEYSLLTLFHGNGLDVTLHKKCVQLIGEKMQIHCRSHKWTSVGPLSIETLHIQ